MLSGDDIYLDIIESSKKSRDEVDRLFGLMWR